MAASLLTMTAGVGQADVFNMPNGEASLQFVTVGGPGNAADPATGSLYGSVGYTYQMGEYDVTVGQYCQFLNAVAAADTYGLYNSDMGTGLFNCRDHAERQSGQLHLLGFVQLGCVEQLFDLQPQPLPIGSGGTNDAPVFDVTWGDAARFANWLQNGQPTNLGEAAGSTETGAYMLNGATSESALMAIGRNAGATYFIPSENEWYKAAYFNPSNGTYWTYPTESNSTPSNVLSATATNNGNFWNSGYTDPTNDLTPVGRLRGLARPLRHVRHGRRPLPME